MLEIAFLYSSYPHADLVLYASLVVAGGVLRLSAGAVSQAVARALAAPKGR